MSSIYSKCILRISADGASDGSGGLLVNRDAKLFGPVAVDARARHSSSEMTPRRQHRRITRVMKLTRTDCFFLNDSHINEDLRQCPLTKRAWVFQERFLAPRVLHVGLHQIVYECLDSDLVSECFPAGGKIFSLPSLSGQLGPFMFNPSTSPEEEWGNIVASYSKRQLSHNSDKLRALAGVARQFAEKNNLSKYIAGFFNFQALTRLLWRVAEVRQELRITESGLLPIGAYVAPSWSWAAVTVPIEFPDISSNDIVHNYDLAHIQGYECELLDSANIFGQLSHASITIKAPFCDITFVQNDSCTSDGSDYLHYNYTGKLDTALKVTQCEPTPRYPFYPTLAWDQLYNQRLLPKLLSIREQDLSNSDRTPQVNEIVSITLDGTLFDAGPKYRVIWIRRRQVEQLYNVDILHEGILLKRQRSRFPLLRKTPYTRVGPIQH